MFTLIKVLPGYYFFWKICQIFGILWKLLFVFQKMRQETFTTSWADSIKIHYAANIKTRIVRKTTENESRFKIHYNFHQQYLLKFNDIEISGHSRPIFELPFVVWILKITKSKVDIVTKMQKHFKMAWNNDDCKNFTWTDMLCLWSKSKWK